MNRGVSSAGLEPGHPPGSAPGPMTLGVTLPADAGEAGEGPFQARWWRAVRSTVTVGPR